MSEMGQKFRDRENGNYRQKIHDGTGASNHIYERIVSRVFFFEEQFNVICSQI